MKTIFPFICCGSVDDGKSTLIGKILLDAGYIKKDQLEDAKKASLKNGSEKIELSMLLDGLITEREQQITIDIAHRFFDYKDIRFHILDCPGHEQYTKNMATAAAIVDTALIVIDCKKGVQPQTIRHIEICDLFNIKSLCICITKCDLIMTKKGTPDKKLINKLTSEINDLMQKFDFDYKIIPVSAVSGFQTDMVFDQIISYAKKNKNRHQKRVIFHVRKARYYKSSRYYIGHSVFNNEPEKENKYTVLPQNKTITVKNKPSTDTIQIKENIEISAGDCITNTKVIVSNRLNHKTIWFDKPTESMILKHGTRCTKIISYSENEIELDGPIIFNDINDVKENGFGIIIDLTSKKTIGCCAFINNNNKHNNTSKKIYDLRKLSQKEQNTRISFLKDKYPLTLLILDTAYICKYYTPAKDNSLQKLSECLAKQNKIIVLI